MSGSKRRSHLGIEVSKVYNAKLGRKMRCSVCWIGNGIWMRLNPIGKNKGRTLERIEGIEIAVINVLKNVDKLPSSKDGALWRVS